MLHSLCRTKKSVEAVAKLAIKLRTESQNKVNVKVCHVIQ
jgi:hypothetical protein